jgi:cell division protein FtsW (lipid II flippase)
LLVVSKARLSIAMPVILLCISLLLVETRDYAAAQSSPVGLMNLHKVWGVLGAAALATAYLMKWGVSRRIGTPNLCLLILLLCALVSFLTSTQGTVIGGWKLIEWVSVFIVAPYFGSNGCLLGAITAEALLLGTLLLGHKPHLLK